MSHVTTVNVEIKSLTALKKACADIGLEFREGQTTYRWWGRHVGDYPIPESFTKADLGKCNHAIGIPGNYNAYEVGVVQRGDSYKLIWDFYNGGYGLQAAVGEDCHKLAQAYSKHVAVDAAVQSGLVYIGEETDEEQNLHITLQGM